MIKKLLIDTYVIMKLNIKDILFIIILKINELVDVINNSGLTENNKIWKPNITSTGWLSWVKTEDDTPIPLFEIKGEKGDRGDAGTFDPTEKFTELKTINKTILGAINVTNKINKISI